MLPPPPPTDSPDGATAYMHGWRREDGRWHCHLNVPGVGYFEFDCDELQDVEDFIDRRGWEAS